MLDLLLAQHAFVEPDLEEELERLADVTTRCHPEQVHHLLAGGGIEIAGRLVGKQELRPADESARHRLYAAHYTVMENANAICTLALRTCGGQAMLKSLPLERLYRDSRCGSLMLPWTAELCLDRLGRECLYDDAERDEYID